ncbi:sensor histidine kinase [Clostridium sp.]|uniref:sensor histidine kinase n=1 Tax=Clostridium sp. TaxID=1506 RepID=UPI002FC7E390
MNFNNFKLIFRIILLIGILFFYFDSDNSVFFFVTYILIVFIISLVQGLVKEEYKKYLVRLLIVINLLYILIGFRIAIILLTGILIEESVKNRARLLAVVIFVSLYSIIYIEDSYIWIYIYLMIITMIISVILSSCYFRIENLENKLDIERKNIHRINNRMQNEAEYYKQSIDYTKLAERNKISRRMHDEVGHVIVASIIRLEASKIILDSDLEKGKKMLEEIIDHLRDGMNDLRNTIHEITPEREEIGINKLRTLVENKFREVDVVSSIKCNGDIERITNKQWMIITDAIKELSTNALKYSECEKVCIIVDVLNKIIRVNFKDDGIGKEKIIKGYGLKKIEESLISKNGELILNGKDGFSATLLFKIE